MKIQLIIPFLVTTPTPPCGGKEYALLFSWAFPPHFYSLADFQNGAPAEESICYIFQSPTCSKFPNELPQVLNTAPSFYLCKHVRHTPVDLFIFSSLAAVQCHRYLHPQWLKHCYHNYHTGT